MAFNLSISSILLTSTIGLLSVTPSAIAATFYDFSIQWADNTSTTGWFEIDEANPDYSYDGEIPGAEATLDQYFTPIDYSINDRGQVFQKNELPEGYSTFFLAQAIGYPEGSENYARYGSWWRSFEFKVKQEENPFYYLEMFYYDSETGYYEQQFPESTYGAAFDTTYRYTNDVTWTRRNPSPEPSTSIPEPSMMLGLVMAGGSFLALRRRYRYSCR